MSAFTFGDPVENQGASDQSPMPFIAKSNDLMAPQRARPRPGPHSSSLIRRFRQDDRHVGLARRRRRGCAGAWPFKPDSGHGPLHGRRCTVLAARLSTATSPSRSSRQLEFARARLLRELCTRLDDPAGPATSVDHRLNRRAAPRGSTPARSRPGRRDGRRRLIGDRADHRVGAMRRSSSSSRSCSQITLGRAVFVRLVVHAVVGGQRDPVAPSSCEPAEPACPCPR